MLELGFGNIALFVFGLIVVLILTKAPVSMVFCTIGVICFTILFPTPMLDQLGPSMWRMLRSFSLTSVVLFVLMGEFMMQGGLSHDLYNCMEKWIYRLPGGLAQVNITACSIFAAISGSSVSTAATMGVIAGPEMEKRGYDNRLTYGSLAAGGTLGILIPPSIPFIIYGAMTSTSVGKLFAAGVLPGIICTLLFMIATAIWALKNPQIAPPAYTSTTWKEKFTALWGFLPSGIMIVSVLGGIYGGIVTPTEAAALGALVAGVLCIIKGRMKVGMLKKCLLSTIVVSSMSYMILAGSSLINFTFNYLRVPEQLSAWVVSMSLTPGMVFFLAVIMYLILGCFIDGISMVVLTVPTVFPLMISLGYDPIWFGVQLVLLVEIALVTPPVGVNLYVLAGIAKNSSFGEICQGVLPYIGCLMIAIVLMFIYPQICLWLPGTM